MEDRDVDVLVVGAGPTGLTAAVELARREVPVAVVDREPGPVEESRALIVQPRTLEIWRDQGIDPRQVPQSRPVEGLELHLEDASPVSADLEGVGGPLDQPLTVPQDVTEQVLVDRLVELGGTVDWETELVGLDRARDGVTARLADPDGSARIRADWVIGADGAHSTVRRELDLPFEGNPYPDRFVVADVDLEADLSPQRIHAWIQGGRLLLIVPLREPGHHRVITTHRPGGAPDVDPDEPPTPAQLAVQVDERATVDVELDEPRWTSVFRVHCRGVPRYRVGRVLLAGDAAHIHSPAGGQGMNTGIQDAHNLAWKLALVQAQAADASLVDTYHDERHPVGQRLLDTTDRAFQTLASDRPGTGLLRRFVVAPLLRLAAVQDRLRRFIAQRAIRYADSPAVGPDSHEGPGPTPGEQPPDPTVHGSDGNSTSLGAALSEAPGHAILVLQGRTDPANLDRLDALAETLVEAAAPVPARAWVLAASATAPDDAGRLADPGGRAHEAWGRTAPGYEILRPDRHVGARSAGLEPDTLEAYLDRLGA